MALNDLKESPNIVHIYDFKQHIYIEQSTNKINYEIIIIMEYANLGTLHNVIKGFKRKNEKIPD